MKQLTMICVVMAVMTATSTCLAVMDGQSDYQRDDLGYYYAITAGKFLNGQTVTGKKDTGGSMAFISDSTDWGFY